MSFRRYVRRQVGFASLDLPVETLREVAIGSLKSRKHAVIMSSWRTDQWEDWETGERRRTWSVKYVTGGQRHHLPAELDWQPPFPGWVEFP